MELFFQFKNRLPYLWIGNLGPMFSQNIKNWFPVKRERRNSQSKIWIKIRSPVKRKRRNSESKIWIEFRWRKKRIIPNLKSGLKTDLQWRKRRNFESKIWNLKILPVSPPPLILPRRLSWNWTRRLYQRRKRGTSQSLVRQVL